MTQTGKRFLLPEFLFALSFAAVIVLAITVKFAPEALDPLDKTMTRSVQSLRTLPIDSLMIFISAVGYYPLSILITAGFSACFLITRNFKEAVFILSTFVVQFFTTSFKSLIMRPRPDESSAVLYDVLHDPSFPSGHVVTYTFLYGFIFLSAGLARNIPNILRISLKTLSMFMIVTVGFSRIYLGAHWLSDVITGYLTGFLILHVILFSYLKPQMREI